MSLYFDNSDFSSSTFPNIQIPETYFFPSSLLCECLASAFRLTSTIYCAASTNLFDCCAVGTNASFLGRNPPALYKHEHNKFWVQIAAFILFTKCLQVCKSLTPLKSLGHWSFFGEEPTQYTIVGSQKCIFDRKCSLIFHINQEEDRDNSSSILLFACVSGILGWYRPIKTTWNQNHPGNLISVWFDFDFQEFRGFRPNLQKLCFQRFIGQMCLLTEQCCNSNAIIHRSSPGIDYLFVSGKLRRTDDNGGFAYIIPSIELPDWLWSIYWSRPRTYRLHSDGRISLKFFARKIRTDELTEVVVAAFCRFPDEGYETPKQLHNRTLLVLRYSHSWSPQHLTR